ncbi:ATP-binding cassette domain-containing protein [Alkalicoccobacillus porphyridii]|uniref:ABC transporter ATP-binding protein n=1 Tax=Alkalicoccobacillus porphyridii TaxID=2597270 RepID=A0A554A3I3_9BACI|nr:ABC transporter ATP-binding protein [Alkalicoccobacillus porphyridii]TSB48252.1 ABC transporter ATP-binding protein [Alkalicoccobacillus porphyridii]
MSFQATVQNVSKSLNKNKVLSSVSCSFEKDVIYGLLGRNGAGKTTLLNMISGKSLPDEGSIKISGQNPFNHEHSQKQICFIRESQNFKPTLSIRAIIKMMPAFYPNWNQHKATELLELFELPLTKKVSQLSKGMESALGITVGIASRAPLTIFDEPYIGMDAHARDEFYKELLDDYTEHPRTIILSTHLIDEVSDLFQEVYFMKKGEIALHETIDNLQQRAFLIHGPKDAIESLYPKGHVLDKSNFMGDYSLTLYVHEDSLDDFSIPTTCKKHKLSLQQLMVYLTNHKEENSLWVK